MTKAQRFALDRIERRAPAAWDYVVGAGNAGIRQSTLDALVRGGHAILERQEADRVFNYGTRQWVRVITRFYRSA